MPASPVFDPLRASELTIFEARRAVAQFWWPMDDSSDETSARCLVCCFPSLVPEPRSGWFSSSCASLASEVRLTIRPLASAE